MHSVHASGAAIRANSRGPSVLDGQAKRILTIAGSSLALLALALGVHFAMLYLGGNFHPVVAGELYRAAQPTPARIVAYQQAHGIRTIVNLRGENPGRPWYDAEVTTAERLGITHLNFRMSAGRELSRIEAANLIALLEQAEKPVLIHCASGIDRSSLAAALYVAAVARLGEAAAESQISLRYGHLPLWFLRGYTMYNAFESLEPFLGFPDS